jgi:hypothetical protein
MRPFERTVGLLIGIGITVMGGVSVVEAAQRSARAAAPISHPTLGVAPNGSAAQGRPTAPTTWRLPIPGRGALELQLTYKSRPQGEPAQD